METENFIAEDGDMPIVNESIESVNGSAQKYLWRHPGYVIALIAGIIAIYTAFFLLGLKVVQFYFVPIFLLTILYAYLVKFIRHEFMRQFARANGFSFSLKGTLDDLDGSLFQIGHSNSVSDVVSGNFRDIPMSLLTYTYVTGQGRSSQTHNFTVFKFHLDVNMPDILLENRNHQFGELFFNRLSGDKAPLSLEGNFNDHFNLSVQKEYEIEALQILTPDIMVDIEEKCQALSLEIVNNHIFLYKDSLVDTKKDLYSLFDCAKYFIEKLAPILSRMKPGLEAMDSQAKT